MKRCFQYSLISLMLCGLVRASTATETITITRQILRGDGTPAVGATVEVRTFDWVNTRPFPPQRLTTDAQGRFTTTVERKTRTDWDTARLNGRPTTYDYVMIDAPGEPLAFIDMSVLRRSAQQPLPPLRLSGKAITGQVMQLGKPRAGATVTATNFATLPLSSPFWGVSTPQLTAQSAVDGSFTMRPMVGDFPRWMTDDLRGSVAVVAKTVVPDGSLMGRAEAHLNGQAEVALEVAPTWTARGTVRDTAGKPLPGARVHVELRDSWPLEVATTDAAGNWRVGDIAPNTEMVAVAEAPGHALGVAPLGEKKPQLTDADRQAKMFADVDLKLLPLLDLKGSLVDADTGAPVVMLPPLPIEIGAHYQDAVYFNEFPLRSETEWRTLGADGRFSLPVSRSDNEIYLYAPLYEPLQRRFTVNGGAGNGQDVVYKARKQPHFFIHLLAEKPDDLYNVTVLLETPQEPRGSITGPLLEGGYWVLPAARWGEVRRVRIVRDSEGGSREIVPLTTITADPKHWPLEIKIPSVPRP